MLATQHRGEARIFLEEQKVIHQLIEGFSRREALVDSEFDTLGPPKVVNIEDLRRLAQRRLPRPVFDYLDGGAEDEITLRENTRAFRDIRFRPRTVHERKADVCCPSVHFSRDVDGRTNNFGSIPLLNDTRHRG